MVLFLDVLAVFMILVLAVVGYQRGFIDELGRLLGLIFALVLGIRFYVPLGGMIIQPTGWDGGLALFVSFSIIFIAVLVAVRLFTRMIQIMTISHVTRRANNILGAGFGALKGGFVLIIAVWLIASFPGSKWTGNISRQSHLYSPVARNKDRVVKLFRLEKAQQRGQIFLNKWMRTDNKKLPLPQTVTGESN